MERLIYLVRKHIGWLIGAGVALVLVGVILLGFSLTLHHHAARPEQAPSFSAMAGVSAASSARAISNPDREVRGVWIASVSNINYPSAKGLGAEELKKELDAIVDTCRELKLNTIFFQVRPASDALYESALFPASEFVSGQQGSGDFDSLAYLIERAEPYDIDIHAWVNPLRVTTTQSKSIEDLHPTNPAAIHPEWTVKYDGKLYYNAGIPEVRQLVADGVREIVEKYAVKGVVFDDYFYPYPVTGQVFDDSAAYKASGSELSRGDWRRENVNEMVRLCYESVKDVRSHCLFGIAPFGIWDNSDGENGGSDTKGLSAYDSLFCDALAWIEGGYIDYIAPQLYWQFTNASARFDVLVRWWNAKLEGSEVDLLISHAAYRSTDWQSDEEIRNQVSYARSERAYQGSVHYGYAAIAANEQGLQEQLLGLHENEIIYPDIVSDGRALAISSPEDGSYMNVTATYVLGTSDPAYPVYLNGEPISRTKSGHFSLYLPLEKGENTFVFTQNGEETVYTLHRGTQPSADGDKKPATLEEFGLSALAPAYDCMLPAGTTLTLRATAPAGSKVSAEIFGKTVKLSATIKPKGSGMLKEVYEGKVRIPDGIAVGTVKDYGKIVYTATYHGDTVTAEGAWIRGLGKDAAVAVEVLKDDSNLKISETSWYYDDYTPASAGMRDMAVALQNGYYKLRCGGYIASSDVKELPDSTVTLAKVQAASIAVTEEQVRLQFGVSECLPVNGFLEDGCFVLTLMNAESDGMPPVDMVQNPIFSSIRGEKNDTRENSYRYYLSLHHPENFYGFSFSYEIGENGQKFLILSLRSPQGLVAGQQPLSGRTVVLDAGHGGNDRGALGPDRSCTEDDLNLAIALAAVEKLRGLGAEVILVREDDTTVSIYDRMDLLCQLNPDLCISIHQNSMDFSVDITRVRGLLALYYADSGVLLSRCVSNAMADSLNRYERDVQKQKLAMVRNAKFPATLVEVGFITCVEEYELLRSEVGIDLAAEGIAEGVLSYYRAQQEYLTRYR